MTKDEPVATPKVGQQYSIYHDGKRLNVEVKVIYANGSICVCEIGAYHVLTSEEFKAASDPKYVFLGIHDQQEGGR